MADAICNPAFKPVRHFESFSSKHGERHGQQSRGLNAHVSGCPELTVVMQSIRGNGVASVRGAAFGTGAAGALQPRPPHAHPHPTGGVITCVGSSDAISKVLARALASELHCAVHGHTVRTVCLDVPTSLPPACLPVPKMLGTTMCRHS